MSQFFCCAQSSDWHLVRDESGIKVFSRKSNNSAIKEIHIKASTKAKLEEVSQLLSNVQLYNKWVYKCETSILIQKKSEEEFVYYVAIDFPFPMTDRDLVIHSKHQLDENGVYRSTSIASKVDMKENSDYIRIPEFVSKWIITPTENNQHLIEYYTYSNPGGDIPSWLINLAIDQGPYQTMKSFLSLLEVKQL